MQCNIDARGKAVRLLGAIALICVGLGLIGCEVFGVTDARWTWITAVTLLTAGGFGIFQARAGWCVVRAMGFRTPL
ncbi:MAG: hypothetical protein HKO59_00130 [Phycisphaerales bacterium]|nr:hypothetical protein [Phycisphaerae bacterium]NNF44814.1 hypothetical protein [Phycisphaerales bacterium]NNM24389.1 hypothetical protein [Phycisphaerales bacterium]